MLHPDLVNAFNIGVQCVFKHALSINKVSAKKSEPNSVSCFVIVLGKVFVNLKVCSKSAKLVNFLSFKTFITFACKDLSSIIVPTLEPKFSKFLKLLCSASVKLI
jgi:hypothetical protein